MMWMIRPGMIKMLGLRLALGMQLHEFKWAVQRTVFCKFFDVHRVQPGYQSIGGSDMKTLKADYLVCHRCNTYYFRNKYQKEQFRRMRESKTSRMKGAGVAMSSYFKRKDVIKEFDVHRNEQKNPVEQPRVIDRVKLNEEIKPRRVK